MSDTARFLATICLVFSVVAGSCLAGETAFSPVAATPGQNWRNTAYQGLLSQLQPRNVNNIKFLFLNGVSPCVYRSHDGKEMHGYGGLVAVRRHKFLWMHSNDTMFFLVDASGFLCQAVSIDSLEQDTVSPSMVTVERREVEEWEEGEWYSEYESVWNHEKGAWEYEYVQKQAPGKYVTVIRKFVTPHLDPQTLARRSLFFKTSTKNLPHCQ